MKRYIIVYDLRKKNRENYPNLYKWFDTNKAIQINESVYLVKSSRTIKEVFDELNALTETGDDLVVNEFPYLSWAKNSKRNDWQDK